MFGAETFTPAMERADWQEKLCLDTQKVVGVSPPDRRDDTGSTAASGCILGCRFLLMIYRLIADTLRLYHLHLVCPTTPAAETQIMGLASILVDVVVNVTTFRIIVIGCCICRQCESKKKKKNQPRRIGFTQRDIRTQRAAQNCCQKMHLVCKDLKFELLFVFVLFLAVSYFIYFNSSIFSLLSLIKTRLSE